MKDTVGRKRGTARRRCRSDRGAVLVESALLLPFIFALVFGIIDFGNTFNDYISVRQGARDGLRMALVNTNPSGVGSCSVGSGGPASGSDAYATLCYTKQRVGLDQTKTAVKLYFSGSYVPGQPVKMCVQYRTSSLTGAYSTMLDNKILSTDVESLIEQSSTSITAFQENSFPDGTAVTWAASCEQL